MDYNETEGQAIKSLIDEAERILLEEVDEGRVLPHLLRAINGARKVFGMRMLRLVIEEDKPK